MDNQNIYYEQSNKGIMPSYHFFIEKLKNVQKLAKVIKPKKEYNNELYLLKNQSMIFKDCPKCSIKKFYQLGNIVWPNNLVHQMDYHQKYPSEYFVKTILNIFIIDNYITNPPMEIAPNDIDNFSYIPLHYNKLLIIDALMNQGSYPRYENKNKYIYSEHSGVISIRNGIVDSIIVSADTERMDETDTNIYLPNNSRLLSEHTYLFHTHPNTSKYGGRISEGIIYEFPSANDIFNFIKYYTRGKAQASVIVAPEGLYMIRPIKMGKKWNVDKNFYYYLKKFILRLEKLAMKRILPIISNISDPDTFHHNVGMDFRCIRSYNRFIEPTNLFVEYYPREKKNGEWRLRPINLYLVKNNNEEII